MTRIEEIAARLKKSSPHDWDTDALAAALMPILNNREDAQHLAHAGGDNGDVSYLFSELSRAKHAVKILETELLEEARLNGMGSEREARLASENNELRRIVLLLAGSLSRCSLVLSGEEMSKGALIRSLEEARSALSHPLLLKIREAQ